MFKHTKKILASLFILAGITLFISCQDQQPVASNDAGQMNLSKEPSLIIPAGATVVSANLKLYAWSWAGDPHNIDIHGITADWSCPVTWTSFGGAFDPTAITSFNTFGLGWKTIDITATVMAWLGGDPDYGLLLKNQDITQGLAQWLSNENEIDPNFAPYLEVILSTDDTIEVEALYDTYISSLDTETDYCDEPRLYCGLVDLGTGPAHKYTLIRFDIEPTPPQEVCETAYAFGPTEFCGLPGIQSNNWGWSRQITGDFSSTTIPIYAGAAQCDPTKGTLVGYLSIEFDETTNLLEVDYDIDPAYSVNVVHMWIGPTILPVNKKGEFKAAPGQYNYNNQSFPFELTIPESFYIAVHFEVCHFE